MNKESNITLLHPADYEKMKDGLTHLGDVKSCGESRIAFLYEMDIAAREAVEMAYADIIDETKKLGGTHLLITDRLTYGFAAPVCELKGSAYRLAIASQLSDPQ